ncbi:MAG: hypothetical protein IKC69_06065 [Clostridia bacterium]|nr:hypothetical protein [Clostridia bacterium]
MDGLVEYLGVVWESISVLLIPPWKDETATIVWCVYLAVVVAWVYSLYRRITVGRNVTALKEAGCHSPETAKEASALKGFSPKAVSRYDRLIETVGGTDSPVCYYLPPEREKKAESLLRGGATKLWKVLLALLGCYLLMVLAYYLAPSLFGLFEDLWPY